MELTGKQLAAIRKAYKLSPRETQIIELIMRGVDRNEDIATVLDLSVLTTKLYVHQLHGKFGTRSKLQMAIEVIDMLLKDQQ